MKKLPLILTFFAFLSSCSEPSKSDDVKKIEEFIPLDYVKNYPDDLQLVKSIRQEKVLYRNPDNTPKHLKISTFTYEYYYNTNNTIRQIIDSWIKKRYRINPDGTQGSEIIPPLGAYQRGFNDTQFNYGIDKIVSIKRFNETILDARCFHNYETIFSYDDLGKLKFFKDNYRDISNNKDWVEEDYVTCKHLGDTIVSKRIDNGHIIKYILDEYGNYKSKTPLNKEVFFDDKNNPNDLIYPKYLLGWEYSNYGSGNIVNDTYTGKHTHIYNEYDFPIETNYEYKYGSTTYTYTTVYEYNK